MPIPFLLGALAVGALGAAAGGVAAHVAASNKNDEAEELLADAKYIYDREKEILLKAQQKTEASIMSLAQCKHKVLETSLKDFFIILILLNMYSHNIQMESMRYFNLTLSHRILFK